MPVDIARIENGGQPNPVVPITSNVVERSEALLRSAIKKVKKYKKRMEKDDDDINGDNDKNNADNTSGFLPVSTLPWLNPAYYNKPAIQFASAAWYFSRIFRSHPVFHVLLQT